MEDGRFRLVSDRFELEFPTTKKAVAAAADREGGLWIATSATVLHLGPRPEPVERLGPSSGLVNRGALAILVDRESNVWFASQRGASKLISRRFANFDSVHGLLEDEVTAILCRRNGDLVFGHDTGITVKRGERFERIPLGRSAEGPPGRRVLDLEEDPSGNLWIAVAEVGLARLDPRGRLAWMRAEDAIGSGVATVRVDREGTVWAATTGRLWHVAHDRLVPVFPEFAKASAIRRLLLDSEGTLYAALIRGGLAAHRGDSWEVARSGEGPEPDSVSAVLRDRRGRIWVGTWTGLFELRGRVLARPSEKALDVRRPVFQLLEDNSNRLWIGTDRGVFRWDGTTLASYDGRDGLAGNETNRAASAIDREGHVWIGTERGASRYDEARDLGFTAPPLVELASTDDRGARLPDGPRSAADVDGHGLRFTVNAISFLDEDRIEYRSRLEGFDADWLPATSGARLEARYTSLPPGRYRFVVQARSARSPWSEPVATGPIVVLAPIWRRWWFLLLAAAFAILAGEALRRYVERGRHARLLAEEVRRRTDELAASERMVAAEREHLAVILASIADGVVVCDRAGVVTFLNPAAEALTGWTAAEALGRPVAEVFDARLERDASSADRSAGGLTHHAGARDPHPAVCVLTAREGAVKRLVAVVSAPLRREDSAPDGRVLAFRDISEERRRDEEHQRIDRLEALGALAAGFAHGLNNQLTVILGALSISRESAGRHGDDDRYLDAGEVAVERARELAERLVVFARGGAPRRSTLSLGPLIREAVSEAVERGPAAIEASVPDDLWDVDADADQIARALRNLIERALDATPEGGIVRLCARNVPAGETVGPGLPTGRYVRLSVSDEGPGLSSGALDRIFDPLFTTRPGATGLELTASWAIFRNHGGTLTAESGRERGTTLHGVLPAAERRTKARGEEERFAGTEPPRPRRVLVMDDQDGVREVIAGMVRQLGFEAVTASDGREAIRLYEAAMRESRPFGVVLLDLSVPGGMGGLETLRELRALDPAVRAVAASGYSDEAAMADASARGFAAALPKPFTLAALRDLLRQLPV